MRSPPLLRYFPYYQHTTVVCGGGGLNKYHRRAGDGVQRPLRSRFPPRLTHGVDMTSNVKSWLLMFLHFLCPLVLRHRKRRSQEETTVDQADIRGLGTTLLASVGCLPRSRHEGVFQPLNAIEGYTKPGLRLIR